MSEMGIFLERSLSMACMRALRSLAYFIYSNLMLSCVFFISVISLAVVILVLAFMR